MKTFYKAWYSTPKIEQVEAESETANFLIVKGRRVQKNQTYESYHETWDEAKQALLDRWLAAVDEAERRKEYAHNQIRTVEKLSQ